MAPIQQSCNCYSPTPSIVLLPARMWRMISSYGAGVSGGPPPVFFIVYLWFLTSSRISFQRFLTASTQRPLPPIALTAWVMASQAIFFFLQTCEVFAVCVRMLKNGPTSCRRIQFSSSEKLAFFARFAFTSGYAMLFKKRKYYVQFHRNDHSFIAGVLTTDFQQPMERQYSSRTITLSTWKRSRFVVVPIFIFFFFVDDDYVNNAEDHKGMVSRKCPWTMDKITFGRS